MPAWRTWHHAVNAAQEWSHSKVNQKALNKAKEQSKTSVLHFATLKPTFKSKISDHRALRVADEPPISFIRAAARLAARMWLAKLQTVAGSAALSVSETGTFAQRCYQNPTEKLNAVFKCLKTSCVIWKLVPANQFPFFLPSTGSRKVLERNEQNLWPVLCFSDSFFFFFFLP